jgi:hypothetical protein
MMCHPYCVLSIYAPKFLPQVLRIKINSGYKQVQIGNMLRRRTLLIVYSLEGNNHRLEIFYRNRLAICKNDFCFLLTADDFQPFVLNCHVPGERIHTF